MMVKSWEALAGTMEKLSTTNGSPSLLSPVARPATVESGNATSMSEAS
jgi:hypothetical protein